MWHLIILAPYTNTFLLTLGPDLLLKNNFSIWDQELVGEILVRILAATSRGDLERHYEEDFKGVLKES